MLNDQEIEKLLIEEDIKAIQELSLEDMEDLVSILVYDNYYKKDYKTLNEEQRSLLLAMALDDCFQANGLETLLEDEDLNPHISDLAEALLYIGAGKSAMEIRKLTELLKKKKGKAAMSLSYPEWLGENPNAKMEIEKINGKLEEKPDGNMMDLIYKFIRNDKDITKKLLQK